MPARLRTALVIGEIAVASLLLVGAGLTLRSFQRLLNAGAGFETAGRPRRWSRCRPQYATIDELEALAEVSAGSRDPRVRTVGATSVCRSATELAHGRRDRRRATNPRRPHARAHPRVTTGFFDAMGMTLVSGRPFGASDHAQSLPVAIVNRTMAERYWPGASPLGRRVRMGGTQEWREVVVVLADARTGPRPSVNRKCISRSATALAHGLLRGRTDHASPSPAAAMRDALRAVDPDLPLRACGRWTRSRAFRRRPGDRR